MTCKEIITTFVCLFLFTITYSQVPEQNKAKNLATKPNPGFIENKGQIVDLEYKPNPTVLYLFNSPGLNIHLRQTGFSYDVYTIERKPVAEISKDVLHRENNLSKEEITWHFHRVDIEMVGCNQKPIIEARGKSADYTNYYTAGTSKEGVLGVHHYSEVYYYNIYNKIDLQFLVKDGKPKYNFVLHPGAKMEDIKLQFKGAIKTELTANGEIKIITREGEVLEKLPLSFYQETGNKIVLKACKLDTDLFGISGEYESTKTIIIDPVPTLIFDFLYPAIGSGVGYDISTDSKGNLLLSGYTQSSNNIASAGHQNTIGGNIDAMLIRFDSMGKRKWGTYYGGPGTEYGHGLSIDNVDNIYLSGETTSAYNISYKGFQDTASLYSDAFLVKFDSSGKRLWGTYYGKLANDYGDDVCADAFGNVYLVGSTLSFGMSYLGHQNNIGGDYDGFIVKFDSSGKRKWASYYGGSSSDNGLSVHTDISGSVYLCGGTNSANNIFFNGHQSSSTGTDAYLVKFDSLGSRLWATYYGGWSPKITTDKVNNVYLAGSASPIDTIGIAFNAYQSTFNGVNDGFLAKFNPQGIRLWSTYYGGTNWDKINNVSADSKDGIFIIGETASTFGIATKGQATFGGGLYDAFYSKFDSSGKFIWGTYYGGTNDDIGLSICTDLNNKIYITGSSSSAFIAKIAETEMSFPSKLNKKYCRGDSVFISYITSGLVKFNGNNIFYIDISDTLGYFQNFTPLAGINDSSISGVLKFKFSQNLTAANNYRIRIRSSSPVGIWELPDSFAYQNNIPNAKFTGGTNGACVNNHIFYATNSSNTYGPPSYLWKFGNGDTSTSSAHFINYSGYTTSGHYVVWLVVKDTFGCVDSAGKAIDIGDNPIADFKIDSTVVCSKTNLKFIDSSIAVTGSITQFKWTFGDGGTSASNSPAYTYNKSGVFPVWLKVKNSFGCWDSVQRIITVHAKPTAAFNVNSTKQCFANNNFIFTNISTIDTPYTMSYFWDFNNGDTSSLKNPSIHYFKKELKYKPRLIAVNDQYNACKDSSNFWLLTFETNPVANFTINDSIQCLQGNSFNFTNTSTVTNISFVNTLWSIGSNSYSSTNLITGVNIVGKTSVLLKITDNISSCWDTISKYIYVLPNPSISSISGALTSKGKKQEVYNVTPTAGSTYQWSVSGGIIISGQGTNQVTVRWNENSGTTGQVSVTETNSDGCKQSANKIVSLSPSSIEESGRYSAAVYPNPSLGEVIIDVENYTDSYNIKIFNRLGQIVSDLKSQKGKTHIDLGDYSAGLYFVKIEGNDFIKIEKIILKSR